MPALDPETQPLDLPLDDAPAAPPRKKGGRRLALLLPALLLAAACLALALNWTAVQVRLAPLWSLKTGAEKLAPLPRPTRVGFLGEVALDELAVNCSGVLDAQVDETGLTLALADCTLGTDDTGFSLSAFLSPRDAAASIPLLAGGDDGWYGVSLERPLLDQAKDTGWSWYFAQEQLQKLQEAADQVSKALADAKSLTGESEAAALQAFLTQAHRSLERTSGGYVLRFSQPEDRPVRQLCRDLGLPEDLFYGPAVLDFSLTGGGVLQGVSGTSANLDFTLDLGEDPAAEPIPRLEVNWTGPEGQANSLTLALTLSQAPTLTPPDYQNAFSLL